MLFLIFFPGYLYDLYGKDGAYKIATLYHLGVSILWLIYMFLFTNPCKRENNRFEFIKKVSCNFRMSLLSLKFFLAQMQYTIMMKLFVKVHLWLWMQFIKVKQIYRVKILSCLHFLTSLKRLFVPKFITHHKNFIITYQKLIYIFSPICQLSFLYIVVGYGNYAFLEPTVSNFAKDYISNDLKQWLTIYYFQIIKLFFYYQIIFRQIGLLFLPSLITNIIGAWLSIYSQSYQFNIISTMLVY